MNWEVVPDQEQTDSGLVCLLWEWHSTTAWINFKQVVKSWILVQWFAPIYLDQRKVSFSTYLVRVEDMRGSFSRLGLSWKSFRRLSTSLALWLKKSCCIEATASQRSGHSSFPWLKKGSSPKRLVKVECWDIMSALEDTSGQETQDSRAERWGSQPHGLLVATVRWRVSCLRHYPGYLFLIYPSCPELSPSLLLFTTHELTAVC